MKPRTKLQHRVIELRKSLPKNAQQLKGWAFKECLQHKGFATKNRVICMDCGNTFSSDLIKRKRAICPHCNTKLRIEYTRRRTDKQREYFAVAEIFNDFQLIRNYEISAHHKAGKKALITCIEVLQHWILENGKREVVGLNHTMNWYYDSWNGEMEIRNKSNKFTYDIYPHKIHPKSKFKPVYKMHGISHRLQGLTPLNSILILPREPKAETLLKAKQFDLLSEFKIGNKDEIFAINVYEYWPSIRICMRNKYVVKDADIWFDYLRLLRYFGKDLRNAKYVCPTNLKKEHDRLVIKKRKKQAKEEEERRRRTAIEAQANYAKFIKRFAHLHFVDKDIEIKPLQSVNEFKEEGEELHHCVFVSEYFNRNNSLILSAKSNGKRLETIEFDLIEMKVVQCRGKHNDNTDYHKQILQLMNRNIDAIKQCMRKRIKKRVKSIAV